jgi:hypothetical protein
MTFHMSSSGLMRGRRSSFHSTPISAMPYPRASARDAELAPAVARETVQLLDFEGPVVVGQSLGRASRNRLSSANPKVEAAGIEPASENASDRTSTRVGTPFGVSRSPAAAGLRA